MNLDELTRSSGEWLRGTGPESDIVMCSRIRLARNMADFPFTNRASRPEKLEIESTFKSISPLVSQMVVYAEGRNYATALVTIERDGTISGLMVEEPSGYRTLDSDALAAVRQMRKLAPLPAAFPKPTLTVHVKFAASSELARPLEFETPSKPMAFTDFMRDVEAGKIEAVTITGQRVSGIYRADRETFHTYAPAQYEGLADTLSAKGILIRRDDRQQ